MIGFFYLCFSIKVRLWGDFCFVFIFIIILNLDVSVMIFYFRINIRELSSMFY